MFDREALPLGLHLGKQKRGGRLGAMGQVLLTDEVERCDVTVELGLLLKESCHKRTLEMLRPQPTEQKLGIGAQGR